MTEPLVDGEFEMTEDLEELLYRQASTPLWDPQARKPSSFSFGPSDADAGKPSFSRSLVVTAQEARNWHQANARAFSHGVWGCSVAEVREANTRTIDDALVADGVVRSPGHAYVDYRGMGKAQKRVVRSILLTAALARKEIPTTTTRSETDERLPSAP